MGWKREVRKWIKTLDAVHAAVREDVEAGKQDQIPAAFYTECPFCGKSPAYLPRAHTPDCLINKFRASTPVETP